MNLAGRFGAAIAAVAPAVLLLGFAYHPYVTNPTDEAALAEAASSDTSRWGLAHLAIGVGYALLALAFIAVRRYLSYAGDERSSVWALPFAVLACALFPILTGMEFALLGAAETGGDVEATQSELGHWFIPILVAGAVCFMLGALGFAIAIVRSEVPSLGLSWIVAGALVVMAAARFVPLGVAQIVIGVGGVVAFWPLAWRMWGTREVEGLSAPGSFRSR